MKKEIKGKLSNVYLRYLMLLSFVLLVLSFFLNFVFLIGAIFVFLGIVLFVFAKAVEKIVMIKEISVDKLREGDWLVDDVKVKGRVIKADWEGLTNDDLKLLKSLKRKIKIKEGLPFVPAFLIAFLLWVFRQGVIDFFVGFV